MTRVELTHDLDAHALLALTVASASRPLLTGLAAGLVASWVKSLSEPPLQRAAERLVPPTTAEKTMVGADPAGQPENMPPAVLVDRLSRRLRGHGLTADQRASGMKIVHYAMGGVFGVGYSLAADRWPALRRGLGAPAGLALYASTHGSTLPLLRLQEPPWRLPSAAVLWEASSHAVYGVVLDLVRRLLDSRADLEDRFWADAVVRAWEDSGKQSRPAQQLWDELDM